MKKTRRVQVLAFGLLLAAVLAGLGCSSDPDTPLGAEFVEDSLIVSRPGEVFQDTIVVAAGDTVFDVNKNSLGRPTALTLGRKNNYEKWPVLRFDFSSATPKAVQSAELVLRFVNDQDTTKLGARFFDLLEPYGEADTLTALSLGSVIDDGLGNPDRVISRTGLQTYPLPSALVENWISGAQSHNGVAVVLEDTTTTKEVILGSRENGTYDPRLKVTFADEVVNFPASDDGTFVEAVAPTPNLVVGDGHVRRSLIPVDVSYIDPKTLVHDARLTLHIVPGSELGTSFPVSVYAPNSSDVNDPGILTGTLVTAKTLLPGDSTAVFRIRTIFEKFVSGEIANNGLVIQFTEEGSSIRQLEFFSSASDSLKPSISMTISNSPTFP